MIKKEQEKVKGSNDFLKIVFLTFCSNIEAEKILAYCLFRTLNPAIQEIG